MRPLKVHRHKHLRLRLVRCCSCTATSETLLRPLSTTHVCVASDNIGGIIWCLSVICVRRYVYGAIIIWYNQLDIGITTVRQGAPRLIA